MSSDTHPRNAEALCEQEADPVTLGQIDEQVLAIKALWPAPGPEPASYGEVGFSVSAEGDARVRQYLGYVPIDGEGYCPAVTCDVSSYAAQTYVRTSDTVLWRYGDRADINKKMAGAREMLSALKILHAILASNPDPQRSYGELQDITV